MTDTQAGLVLSGADQARLERMFARLPATLAAWLEASDSMADAHPAMAEAAYQRTMARFPNAQQPVLRFARLAVQRGDWVAANQRWAAALARFPDQHMAVHGLFEALMQCGAPALAELALAGALAFPEAEGGIPARLREGLQVKLARARAIAAELDAVELET